MSIGTVIISIVLIIAIVAIFVIFRSPKGSRLRFRAKIGSEKRNFEVEFDSIPHEKTPSDSNKDDNSNHFRAATNIPK